MLTCNFCLEGCNMIHENAIRPTFKSASCISKSITIGGSVKVKRPKLPEKWLLNSIAIHARLAFNTSGHLVANHDIRGLERGKTVNQRVVSLPHPKARGNPNVDGMANRWVRIRDWRRLRESHLTHGASCCEQKNDEQIFHKRSKPPNDPKLSHGHRRLAHACNLDFQISWLNPKLKGQWPLAPARC